MIAHRHLVDVGGGTDGLFLYGLLVPLQFRVEPALAERVVGQSGFIEPTGLAAELGPSGLGVRVLVYFFELPLKAMDVLHVLVEILLVEMVEVADVCERVGAVLLKVVLVAEAGSMGGSPLEFESGEALEVVVAGVEAEPALVVNEFILVVETQTAVGALVILDNSATHY